MNWIFMTLLAAGLETISNLHDRFVLKHALKHTDTLLVIWRFAGFMFAAPALLMGVFSYDPWALGLGFVSAILYLAAMHYYYRALNNEEVSRVIPILSINPIIVLILATIFLGETHTDSQSLGIGLIITGVLIHAIDGQHHYRLINKQALLWAFLAASGFALKNVLIKWLSLNPLDPLNILCWVGIGIFIFNIPVTIKLWPRLHLRKNPRLHNITISAALGASTTLIYSAAITLGPAALVAFLHRIQIFFVFLISEAMDFVRPQILREKFSTPAFYQKFIGVIIILIGSFFLL